MMAKFYGDNSADMTETLRRVIQTDPAFVAHLAVYARRASPSCGAPCGA